MQKKDSVSLQDALSQEIAKKLLQLDINRQLS
jgi:hypothetical protein